ncbi:MAG TPA: hypothetical protein PKB00_11160 [Microthrixaceae bacterium]|nr:hypothetical protein [Microthrixaceae bacterium]
MPWRGPVTGSDYLDDLFPSLGWAIAADLDDLFPWMPCTDEQVRKLVHIYRLHPDTGRRVYRRGQLMGPKGVGKSPEAAKFAIAELELGIIFDGWDAAGEPVGRPRSRERDGATPWVQIAAVSLDQTDNTYGALLELLTENDSSAADALGLDPGDTRTVRRSNHRARIDKVTASAGAREGQPITAAVIDESHLYLPSNGGKKLAATIRRNAAKMGGFTLETTNNYDPSLETVAQATDEAVGDKAEGIYQWKPQAPHVMSLADTRSLRKSLKILYAGSPWVDIERLIEDVRDPDTTEADARRFYLNETWQGADAAWSADLWAPLADPDKGTPPDRDLIALGFDGARFHDATAIVGVRLEDRHEFLIAVWERPVDVDDDDWEVPGQEVAEAMAMAFDRWKVHLAYFDPPYWESEIDGWAGQWSAVKKWWTNRTKPMAYSVRAFDQMVRAGGCSYDGSNVLTRHTLNAQKRTTTVRDDDGRFLWTIQKKGPKSPLKIDARMAGILAHEAAGDAITLGALRKKRSGNAVFI